MSNCNECLKVNAIPGCIDSDVFLLTGITFPDYDSQTLTGFLKNVATGRADPFDVDVDGSGVPTIDLADYYPLPDHPFELRFIDQDGVPANFVITNPDATTATGCCIEFSVHPALIATGEWDITTQTCAV